MYQQGRLTHSAPFSIMLIYLAIAAESKKYEAHTTGYNYNTRRFTQACALAPHHNRVKL